ncbi:uncharacterized protein BO95DRAFT_80330 [Aspergillus brunneoviolaceus CBS 621.78]|uniref:Uncharacterized protein n=1 Tax=Aspergillus brunneoviolaceus CBS 621.78 TaxID=1450534 RepID=A0ACD1GEB4_9EURO|nr:hypothetical protein BO95DRAFT_80330 [Aspergillus brunneoviolaceus CBS 621.78]RAH47593.1 hypothetical protein BO95DRAFT_80330 [Aspergillus brunneoviolaceus CBS 621.78]
MVTPFLGRSMTLSGSTLNPALPLSYFCFGLWTVHVTGPSSQEPRRVVRWYCRRRSLGVEVIMNQPLVRTSPEDHPCAVTYSCLILVFRSPVQETSRTREKIRVSTELVESGFPYSVLTDLGFLSVGSLHCLRVSLLYILLTVILIPTSTRMTQPTVQHRLSLPTRYR